MKSLLLFIAVAFSNCLFSQTNEWKYILYDSKGNFFYYKANTNNTGWIKTENKETIYYDAQNKKRIVDGYVVSLWKFDCDERQIGIVQSIAYSKNNKLLQSDIFKDYEIEMNYVMPDSKGEAFLKAFCEE